MKETIMSRLCLALFMACLVVVARGGFKKVYNVPPYYFSAHLKNVLEEVDRIASSVNWLESDRFNPFLPAHWSPPVEASKPWWQGPNVCHNKTEDFQNSTEMMTHYSTNLQQCDLSESAYKCQMIENNIEGRREVTLIYECCHGYERKEGDFGCPKKLKMKKMIDKAQDLGLTEFLKTAKMLDLMDRINSGNFTIFAPVNGAFGLDDGLIESDNGLIKTGSTKYLQRDAPAAIEVSEPVLEKTIQTLRSAILGHMVAGARRSTALRNEQVLDTGSFEGSTIRINFYARPAMLMTANCVPVTSLDNMATNGVIHIVEKALKPVTQTLLGLVRSRPELTLLKTIISAADFVPKLEEDGQYTLLAPTNGAFRKMNRRLREKLFSGDKKCVENVIRNHMLQRVECSASFAKRTFKTMNLLNKAMIVHQTDEGKVFVNGGVQLISKDIMGVNGVMHIIDEVMIPEEALGFLDVLERDGYTELVTLVESAGLTKTLDSVKDMTLLAPTNKAIQDLPLGLKSKLVSDKDLLKKVLTYHVSPSRFSYKHLRNNELISTIEGRQVRLNTFPSDRFMKLFFHESKTAQCIPIVGEVIKTCNGQLASLSKMMIPPVGNVIDVLASDKRFSTLVRLLKRAGLAHILQSDGPFTVFAPNNKAFDKLGKRTLVSYLKDTNRLAQLLKSHILGDNLCCSGIYHYHHSLMGSRVKTLSGKLQKLSRDGRDIPTVSRVRIVKCDKTANNGNILEIEQVLASAMPRRLRHNKWRRYYDILTSSRLFHTR